MTSKESKRDVKKSQAREKIMETIEKNGENKAFFFGDIRSKNETNEIFHRNNPNLRIDVLRSDFNSLYKFFNNPHIKVPFTDGTNRHEMFLPKTSPEASKFLFFFKQILRIDLNQITNPHVYLNPISQNTLLITVARDESESSEYFDYHAEEITYKSLNKSLEYIFGKNNVELQNRHINYLSEEWEKNRPDIADFKCRNDETDLELLIEYKFVSKERFSNSDFKSERFKVISGRRLQRVQENIKSFDNFLNPSNSRKYHYNIEDFEDIADKVGISLNRFINKFQKHFKDLENKDRIVKHIIPSEGKPFTREKKLNMIRENRERDIFTHSLLESEKNIQDSFNKVLNKAQERMEKKNNILEKKLELLLDNQSKYIDLLTELREKNLELKAEVNELNAKRRQEQMEKINVK
tara:strand:+ start:563 stop:1789 length:1227 start_codon:yes stop_codon:yes gene_type:complete